MRITSVRVSNMLSFGDEQSFERFSQFNLFIGQNGSGKSNILRLLASLPMEFKAVAGQVPVAPLGNPAHGTEPRQLYGLRMPWTTANRDRHHATGRPHRWSGGHLQILYEYGSELSGEEVLFEYGELVRGDVARLRNAIGIVVPARTTDEFLGQFANMCQANALRIVMLEFGLWYIFGYPILFDRSGTFGEVKCRAPGHSGVSAGSWSPGYRYDEIASGIFQCAKLLVSFLISDKPVLLIDEPELFLEARTCRRLLDVLSGWRPLEQVPKTSCRVFADISVQ